jgi:hypothetical protein
MRAEQRRGAIIVLSALFLPIAIGFAALAIDAGFLWTERSMLQNTADASALACASALPGDTNTANRRGEEFIRQNPTFGPVADSQILLGVWDRGRFLPRFDAGADSCRVIVGRNDSLFFAPIFNIKTARVTARATATRSPGDANISLVLDNSGSMRFDIGRLRAAATLFVDRLAQSSGNHAVALTTFSSTARNRQPLTQDFSQVRRQIQTMQPQEWTNIGDGMFHGRYEAWDDRQGAQPIPMDKARNIMIVLSDGETNRGRGGEPGQDCSSDLTNEAAASREVALCEAEQFKCQDPGNRGCSGDDPNENMLISISLGYDLDIPLMTDIASDEACRETPAGGRIQKSCDPGEPRCCHYRAPSAENLDAIFREVLSNGSVHLVE